MGLFRPLSGLLVSTYTLIGAEPRVAARPAASPMRRPVAVRAPSSFEPKLMLPLSLSYDHRVIDGADAARFLRWVAEAFEQPFVLAL